MKRRLVSVVTILMFLVLTTAITAIPVKADLIPASFDTGIPANPYPSIWGTHTGTIRIDFSLLIHQMYTYTFSNTAGQTKYVRIYGNGIDVNGYQRPSNYHYVDFAEPFILEKGFTYDYEIRTYSYPMIHHVQTLTLADGEMTCTEFIDANGKKYYDWIPAVRFDGYLTTIEVEIDIKPGSDPNSVNMRSRGHLPVAILGNDEFDVSSVDPETIKLGSVSIDTRGSTKKPKLAYSYEDVNGDGFTDMITFFSISQLVSNGDLTETTISLILTGQQFNGGSDIEGVDSINIVPP